MIIKVELLKEKIDDYYNANEECIKAAEKKYNWESVKYFKALNFSLNMVKEFMEDIEL